jgi:Asp-tRNA(Asn)/Glu-tRNA(Gln) amidotransferase A subunit family amidase
MHRAALEKIRSLGIDLIEVTLPDAPVVPVELILNAESIVSLRDPIEIQPAGLVRQDRVQTRTSYEFLSAADYLNANRARLLLMREMDKVMSKVDVYVLPYDYADYTPNPVAERSTGITNLTGHPSITLPHGFDEKGHPTGLSFIGQLFGEAKMLALAKAYQDATEWHRKHPLLE